MEPASTTLRRRPYRLSTSPSAAAMSGAPWDRCSTTRLKDEFANHTRLRQVKRNGDLIIQGEITQYSQRNKAVSSEGYSAQTELSMTVNVKFTNTKNHKEDFEKQFTATQTYETTQSLASVQEQARRTDVRRPHRPDIQRYGGQLVKSNNRKNGYCAFNQTP